MRNFSVCLLALLFIGALAWGLSSAMLVDNSVAPVATFPTPTEQPEELGRVHWLRDMAAGEIAARESGKPIFLLFQEIPGCGTCRYFGNEALSHPLIVEAIETFFIPVAIHNNKPGADAEVLAWFGEPAWNNPVVRIVRKDRSDITPRLAGDYSPLGVVISIRLALQKLKQQVPTYLILLEEELRAQQQGVIEVTLGMYCFWTGERELGTIPGVIATDAGYMQGREVVRVSYDPQRLDLSTLLAKAKAARCADVLFQSAENSPKPKDVPILKAGPFRLDAEPKYYLFHSQYRYVPMTPLQYARANALLAGQQSPETVLSPRQIALTKMLSSKPMSGMLTDPIREDFTDAWWEIQGMIKRQ